MYPDTMAFMRFMSPSRLALPVQAHIREASELVLRGLGLDHGFFNLEFFVQDDGSLKLIEVNPRLAAQLAEVHDWVGGTDTYELGFAMSLGRALPAPRPAAFGAAASFVWRRFDGGSCPRMPSSEDLAWLAREYPHARLELYPKTGNSLHREIKWLGSHRYAVLNMPGDDEVDLRARYERVCRRLGWPAPW
jgi:hypothetical protein